MQTIRIQTSVDHPTVGAIHELPLLPSDKNRYMVFVLIIFGKFYFSHYVEIYSYAPGDLSTGWGQIINSKLFPATLGIQPESLRNYFQRTRQPEEIAPWIAYELATETNADTANISQLYEEARQANYIDFIIRLTPVIENNLPLMTIILFSGNFASQQNVR